MLSINEQDMSRELRDHFVVSKKNKDCSTIVFMVDVKNYFYLIFLYLEFKTLQNEMKKPRIE